MSSPPLRDLSTQLKRQVIRWLIANNAAPNVGIIDLLDACLEDADWEVRMSAVLAAGRLNITRLAQKVERAKIPTGSRDGFDSRDHDTLVAIRQVIVAHLEGWFTPSKFDDTVVKMGLIPAQFIRAVLGMTDAASTSRGEIGLSDAILIEALTIPSDTDIPIPQLLPPGVELRGDSAYLGDTGIELVWIAPTTHILGDSPEHIPTANPIRRHTPERGYFISKRPLSAITVAVNFDDHSPQNSVTNSDQEHPLKEDYVVTTLEGAQRLCDSLAALTGAKVELPTPDEWEMAARGPDGRRYPTGNGLERDMLLRGSPWGVFDAIGVVGQWCVNPESEKGEISAINQLPGVFICGDERDPRCAARRLAKNDEESGVRVVCSY